MMGGAGTERGVIPRLCEALFTTISARGEGTEFSLEVSYLEIYNEKVLVLSPIHIYCD